MGSNATDTMTAHATAADFTRWEEMADSMNAAQLHYAATDCFQTAQNWRGVDSVVEGYYLDQGCTFADALNRRRRIGAAIWQDVTIG